MAILVTSILNNYHHFLLKVGGPKKSFSIHGDFKGILERFWWIEGNCEILILKSTGMVRGDSWGLLLILRTLHDLTVIQYSNSQGSRHLGHAGFFSPPCYCGSGYRLSSCV